MLGVPGWPEGGDCPEAPGERGEGPGPKVSGTQRSPGSFQASSARWPRQLRGQRRRRTRSESDPGGCFPRGRGTSSLPRAFWAGALPGPSAPGERGRWFRTLSRGVVSFKSPPATRSLKWSHTHRLPAVSWPESQDQRFASPDFPPPPAVPSLLCLSTAEEHSALAHMTTRPAPSGHHPKAREIGLDV